MAKLHELLAVNGSLEGQAAKCLADLKKTFQEKVTHFTQRQVEFHPSEVKSGETAPQITVEEQLKLQSKVKDELKWISDYLIKAVDSSHQVNVGNTLGRADVVLDDGTVMLKDVPGITLLELEKIISDQWKSMLMAAPTLDPAKGFEPDESQGGGIWKSRTITRTKTAKKQIPIVLYEATDKHPAQTQLITEDVPIGTVVTQEWSGMITPAEKAELLNRCEILYRAVRKARSRANEIDVDTSAANRIGAVLWNYIETGKK